MAKIKLDSIFLYLFLILFPFGQIINIWRIHPIDIIVFLAAGYTIIKKIKRPVLFNYFENLIFILLIGFVFSFFTFYSNSIILGALYLIRLISYFFFFIYVYSFVKKSNQNKKFLTLSIISVITITALFGWVQYFFLSDFKPFTVYGWDEHLNRIVGTFIDPTFLSYILIIGIILSPNRFLDIFLTLTLAFTYSRAGYLAFLPAVLMRKKYLFVLVLTFFILVLPKQGGEGVKLERTSSIFSRIINYEETLTIIKKSPVLGVGFNNMCLARVSYINKIDSYSNHACSGSDSSILFILATTGIIGLMSFMYLISKIWIISEVNLKAILVSLFVHSLFSNSIFYSWILGVVMILIALSLSRSKVKL